MSITKTVHEMTPEAPVGEEHVLRVMTSKDGDLQFTWKPEDEGSVAVAEREFTAARSKGYAGYAVERRTKKATILREFDPKAEVIVMSPPMVGG